MGQLKEGRQGLVMGQGGGNATERSPHQNTRKERRAPEARNLASNVFIHLSPILICPLSLEVFKKKR